MVEIRQIILASEGAYIVDRANLIFCACPICLNEINWRHVDATYELTGECCCVAHRAVPANSKLSMYRISCKPANMTNVYWMHRRGVDTYFNPKGRA